MDNNTFFVFKENTALVHGMSELGKRIAALEKKKSKKLRGRVISTLLFGGLMFVGGMTYERIKNNPEIKDIFDDEDADEEDYED